MATFLVQTANYPGWGVRIALRDSLEEAIALREQLNSLGFWGVSVVEFTENHELIYHDPKFKSGDPLGLHQLLAE